MRKNTWTLALWSVEAFDLGLLGEVTFGIVTPILGLLGEVTSRLVAPILGLLGEVTSGLVTPALGLF